MQTKHRNVFFGECLESVLRTEANACICSWWKQIFTVGNHQASVWLAWNTHTLPLVLGMLGGRVWACALRPEVSHTLA